MIEGRVKGAMVRFSRRAAGMPNAALWVRTDAIVAYETTEYDDPESGELCEGALLYVVMGSTVKEFVVMSSIDDISEVIRKTGV